MRNVNRRSTTPLKYPRTYRNHPVMHLSSAMPGYCVPVAVIPMFREDALIGQLDHVIEMLETKEILLNRVSARFTAWCVPFLVADRFNGSRDEFDRSYMGEASLDGSGVIDFMETEALPAGGAKDVPLYKALGLHGAGSSQVNTFFREAYNQVWNHRAKNASAQLTPRALTDKTLAPAFWQHRQFPHIVADFDQAMMEGRVALEFYESKLPVQGIGVATGSPTLTAGDIRQTDGTVLAATQRLNATSNDLYLNTRGAAPNVFPEVYAEMENAGIAISLAGFDQARKLQSFAKARAQFDRHDDDYIIDMLMMGVSIPDQHLKQPFMLADQTVYFRQGKRYATDSGNLDDSATSGFARATTRLRCPRLNTGGIVLVMMEILPEQLWERQEDWFFRTRPRDGRAGHDYWPEADRDELDQYKVDMVQNRQIDVAHSAPASLFGWEPMNAQYNRTSPTIGGKFHRPSADTLTDTHRQRIWAVEGTDPSLTDSFFIAEPGTVHIKPFLDQVNDPFELASSGNCVINGNTRFGGVLIEATGNYDAVAAKAPTDMPKED